MIEALLTQGKIKDCSFDFNGNHVVQKILVKIKSLEKTELYKNFLGEIDRDVIDYSKHEYCCRIVQRLIENCTHTLIFQLIDKILVNYHLLINDQYGTFVLCSILESGNDHQKSYLIN